MSAIVLIVGSSGLVGRALLQEFSQWPRVVGTFCHHQIPDLVHLDLRDQCEVRAVVRSTHPDVVLCPAAEPDVELCEIDPSATRRVNVEGLQNLIEACAEVGALLAYFSSEYVFDGTRGMYSEDDECAPLNEYGRQKLESERMISSQLERYLIARISGVYDWEQRKRNFVVRLIESLSSGQPFKVPSDQVITPTYAPSLARIVRRLIAGGHCGLFHLAGTLALPRTDFANLVAEVFGLNSSLIVPVCTSELNLRAPRPRAAGLSTAKVRNLLRSALSSPLEGLSAMRNAGDAVPASLQR